MIRVVQRALAVLECFDAEHPHLALHEIAARIGIPKTTVFRLLGTLVETGYLVQMSNQEYCLSHKLMRLAVVAQRTFQIRDIVRPVMLDIGTTTRETVDLSMLSGLSRVCVDVFESPHPLKSIVSPGETLPLTSGASGKVLLAFSEPAFVQEVLAAAGRINRKRFLADLKKVRAEGYAYTRGERVPGASALAVPLRDHLGRVRHCLALTGPSFRFDPKREAFTRVMTDAGRRISRLLGDVQAGKAAGDAA